MDNIVFSVTYNDANKEEIDVSKLVDNINLDDSYSDEYVALSEHYMTNFTKKQLTLIAEYYGLNKRNLNKRRNCSNYFYL